MSKEVAAAKAEEDRVPEPMVQEQEATSAEETVIQDQETPSAGEGVIQEAPVKYKVNFRYGLNLRAGPGKQFRVLRVLPDGAEMESDGLTVERDGIQWLSVECGWVDSAYLILVSAEG